MGGLHLDTFDLPKCLVSNWFLFDFYCAIFPPFQRSQADDIALGLAVPDDAADETPKPAMDYNTRRTEKQEELLDDGKVPHWWHFSHPPCHSERCLKLQRANTSNFCFKWQGESVPVRHVRLGFCTSGDAASSQRVASHMHFFRIQVPWSPPPLPNLGAKDDDSSTHRNSHAQQTHHSKFKLHIFLVISE